MSPEWVGVAGGDQKKFAGAGQIMGKAERPLNKTAKIFYSCLISCVHVT